MTALLERQTLVADINAAKAGGATVAEACKEVGISLRTYRRWSQGGEVRADRRPDAARPDAPWRLSEAEQQAVLASCMEPRFADMPPTQIVPILADEGYTSPRNPPSTGCCTRTRRSTIVGVPRHAPSGRRRATWRPAPIRSGAGT